MWQVAHRRQPIAWVHPKNSALGGGITESLSVSDSFSVVVPPSGRPSFHFRHRHQPVAWTHPRGTAVSPGAMGESASVTDTVTASWGTSASFTDALTITDAETYPGGVPLLQMRYLGRRAAILFRQPESGGAGISYTAGESESLSASDSAATTATFSASMAELLTALEHYTGAHPVRIPPGGGRKRHEDDDFEELGLIIGLINNVIKR